MDKNELSSWLALCAVTGYCLEVSGDLALLDETQLELLNRTIELSCPERKFRCLDIPCGEIENPPAFWVAGEKNDRLIAVFNWGEKACKPELPEELTKILENPGSGLVSAWDGKPARVAGAVIPPHGSLLMCSEKILYTAT